MVAKLQACRAALAGGVRDVVIANGRETKFDALAVDAAPRTGCTQVVR
jgi:acetylglutamate kinase